MINERFSLCTSLLTVDNSNYFKLGTCNVVHLLGTLDHPLGRPGLKLTSVSNLHEFLETSLGSSV